MKRPRKPSNTTVKGQTILWGYLVRVGGKRPRAVLRMADDTTIPIKVSRDLAQELGTRLYGDVGIEGVATWRMRDWKVLDFKGTRLTEYDPQSNDLATGFKELAKASQGRWDNVDADEYIRQVRGEE